MLGRLLVVAKYELKKYGKNYFEQAFIFASIFAIFFLLSVTDYSSSDVPSAYNLYKVGVEKGSIYGSLNHYSIDFIEYDLRGRALEDLRAKDIDVWIDEIDGNAVYLMQPTIRAESALKRLKQVVETARWDRIYELADVNESLDGILLPIKIKTLDVEVDYGNSIEPEVYLNRMRFINREQLKSDTFESKRNILVYESIESSEISSLTAEFKDIDFQPSDAEPGVTLPQEWDIPFVFKSIYHNMAVVSVSILFSIMLMINLAKERVNQTMHNLFQTPLTRFEILFGKALPYFFAMLAINLGYSIFMSNGLSSVKVFYILSILSVTLTSFSIFSCLVSKNYREVTFTGSLSLLAFLMFIVLPNIFSGINVLAFISPLDTITSLLNNVDVPFKDVFLSLLAYKLLAIFFITFSIMIFEPQTFEHPPGPKKLFTLFYGSLSKRLGGGITYVAFAIAVLVPFVYIIQSLMAYLLLPLGIIAPFISIFALALVEETVKILPILYSRRFHPAIYAFIAGSSFFITEKLINIYLITKVYSHLPAPYTIFILKGLVYTYLLHMFTSYIQALNHSKNKSGLHLILGIILATLLHFIYNLGMMRWGLSL